MQKVKIEYLTKLTVWKIRLVAKKLSIHLYSRKNKEELIKLILKDQEKFLFEDETKLEDIAQEEKIAFENAKAEEERISIENASAEEERISIENARAEEEKIAFENAKAEEQKNVIFDNNSNLKRLLSEYFPNKKISVTDNNDGSQTILIH